MVTNDDVPMSPEYMDYAEHERTYAGFTTIAKYVVIVIAAILILLAYFLV